MVKDLSSKYTGIVELLAYLVKEKVYGPVDRLARATDLETIYTALYEALRYASTEVRKGLDKIPSDEEIKQFLDEVNRRGASLARRIAIEALTTGLSRELKKKNIEKEKEGSSPKEKTESSDQTKR